MIVDFTDQHDQVEVIEAPDFLDLGRGDLLVRRQHQNGSSSSTKVEAAIVST